MPKKGWGSDNPPKLPFGPSHFTPSIQAIKFMRSKTMRPAAGVGTLLLLAVLTGCAQQPPKMAASRWPQVTIKAPRDQLREAFLARFATEAAAVDEVNDSSIHIRLIDPRSDLAKLFFGCQSCDDPYIKAIFIFSEIPAGTQITAQYWRVIPLPNGERKIDIDDADEFNKTQKALWSIRDRWNSTHGIEDTLKNPATDSPVIER